MKIFPIFRYLLIIVFVIAFISCKKEAVDAFPTTYWVSESSYTGDGDINTNFTLWFQDKTNFMLFYGDNPAYASVPILTGTYQVEGNKLFLSPSPVYSSVVPGGCSFAIQTVTITNQPVIIEGVVQFNGIWQIKGNYSIISE